MEQNRKEVHFSSSKTGKPIPMVLQFLLTGCTYALEGPSIKDDTTMEFRPDGELKIGTPDSTEEGLWSGSGPNKVVAMGRQFDIVFDRVQCCVPKRLEETDESQAMYGNKEPMIGKLLRDSNEARRRQNCPRDNAIRIDLLIDASASLSKLGAGVALGINSFLESTRVRVSDKTATSTRVRLRIFGTQMESSWWCTPLESAPRVDAREHLVLSSSSEKAEKTKKPHKTALYDVLGQALSDLDVMSPRIVIVVTDGKDTASKKWSKEKFAKLAFARRRMGWTFMMLSAYDAHERHPGPSLGFCPMACYSFRADPAGVRGALLLAAAATARCAEGFPADFTDTERLSAATGCGCLYDFASAGDAAFKGHNTGGGQEQQQHHHHRTNDNNHYRAGVFGGGTPPAACCSGRQQRPKSPQSPVFTASQTRSHKSGNGGSSRYSQANSGGSFTFGGGGAKDQDSSPEDQHLQKSPRQQLEAFQQQLRGEFIVSLVVDGSGSMKKLLPATVNAINNFVDALRHKFAHRPGRLQLHVFGDIVRSRWGNGRLLGDVPRVRDSDLLASKKTALLDALAITLSTQPVEVPQFLCVITDGRDNASHQFTADDVFKLVAERRRAKWTFFYLDAASPFSRHPGPDLGFNPDTSTTFSPTPAGVSAAFRLAANAVIRVADGDTPHFTLAERTDACCDAHTNYQHYDDHSIARTTSPRATI